MQINRLYIRNIASFQEATIDFTKAPLSNADVFLISGTTGSGKTTILDAICLALYNTTPRIVNLPSRDKVEYNVDNLTPSDPRQLMRRQTGEAKVELNFTGNDGVDYLATWHVQRGKNKKTTAKLDNLTWSLRNVNEAKDIAVGTGNGRKSEEVAAAIAQVVGLDFNQFCRTTLLAQDEFTRFLKSNEKEKAEILEKLTQFTEFSRAGETIYKIAEEKKRAYEDAKENAKDTCLGEEELAAKQSRFDALKIAVADAASARDAAEEKRQWLQEETDINASLLAARNAYAEAEAVENTEENRRDQALVEEWDATVEARAWLSEKRTAQEAKAAQQKELDAQEATFRVLQAGLQAERAFLQARQQDVRATEEKQAHEQPFAGVFEQLSALKTRFAEWERESMDAARYAEKIEEGKRKLEETVEPAVASAKSACEQAAAKQSEWNAKIEAKDAELRNADLNSLRQEQIRVERLLARLDVAAENVEAVSVAQRKHAEAAADIEAQAKALSDKEARYNENVSAEWESASAHKNACAEAEARMRDAAEVSKQLRAKLTIGCTCPVCQQTVSELPDVEEKLNELFAKAQKELAEATSRFESATNAKNTLSAEINTDRKFLADARRRFDADTSIAETTKKALASCLECGMEVSVISEKTADLVAETRLTQEKRRNEKILPALEKGTAIEKELDELRKAYKKASQDADAARDALSRAEQDLASCKNEIENDGIRRNEAIADAEKHQASIDEILVGTPWQSEWHSGAKECLQIIEHRADLYKQNADRLRALADDIQSAEVACSKTEEILHGIQRRHTAWSSIVAASSDGAERMKNLLQKANDFNVDFSGSLLLMEKAESAQSDAEAKLSAFVESHPRYPEERLAELASRGADSIAALRATLWKNHEAVVQCKGELEAVEKRCGEHAKTRPSSLADTDDVASLEALAKESLALLNQNNQEMGFLQKELDDDAEKRKNLGKLREIAEAAGREMQKWKLLDDCFGGADGSKFRRIAQSFILEGLLEAANAYLAKLANHYRLKAVPGTLYISLEDSRQNFEKRSTYTLSGGEGFLASLALALALADIGEKLSVDTLFIDEGFGSLDDVPLENAIGLLRSLHSHSGRRVGLISHVQAVRENIPVQIQVRQPAGSSSSTIEITDGM